MGNCRLSGLYKQSIIVFLSTLPVGGATSSVSRPPRPVAFLSTLPVGGATLHACYPDGQVKGISIHAPRGGSDFQRASRVQGSDLFLSTLPVGGATDKTGSLYPHNLISIHAPRGGSDFAAFIFIIWHIIFLSTLPVGGATANMIIFHSYLQQFIMQSDNFF